MSETDDRTVDLLRRWHEGDSDAIRELVELNADWVLGRVRARLRNRLREKLESIDVVQEAMVEVLRYSPRFVVADRGRFRMLLAKIVENVICDQHEFFAARRRAMSKEAKPGEISLDAMSGGGPRPSQQAADAEDSEWLRLALELLDPEDRAVIVLRQFDELSFQEVGERLGLEPNATRMRFARALPKLARTLESLRNGSWHDARD